MNFRINTIFEICTRDKVKDKTVKIYSMGRTENQKLISVIITESYRW